VSGENGASPNGCEPMPAALEPETAQVESTPETDS
jgi:hypothetical protein